jgi:hypothetical protein
LITNNNASFLLLNNEFRNLASLTGFQLYGAGNGSITIQVNNINIINLIIILI